jgi:hypothetical protein
MLQTRVVQPDIFCAIKCIEHEVDQVTLHSLVR